MQILSSVLLWNFALTNQLNRLPNKVKKDFVPTLVNGEHWVLLFCVVHTYCIAMRHATPVMLALACNHEHSAREESSMPSLHIKNSSMRTSHAFACSVHAGWKFWVPASVVNFWVVPLQYRVLWMSTCGLFWAGYLSYTSNT